MLRGLFHYAGIFGPSRSHQTAFSAELSGGLYVLPGTDHLNAAQGPDLSLWLSSPASTKHFFYRQTLRMYQRIS
jgi:frataxin-like iron-binding protein CyaY